MSDLHHECGVVAVYHLPGRGVSRFAPLQNPDRTTDIIPQLLLDIQNRGQLAAGCTTWKPNRPQLIDTHKELGTVSEVFHLNHRDRCQKLLAEYAGAAGIGHVRYATCGAEDRSYAQPFERHHLRRKRWFSFGFNGQLANYQELRDEILNDSDFHLARETDTEIIMHHLSQELSVPGADLVQIFRNLSTRFDGSYNIVFLNAAGEMVVARDPLGIRPICYAIEGEISATDSPSKRVVPGGPHGPMFAAASESVALAHMGFEEHEIHSLAPGEAIVIRGGELELVQFAESTGTAHCFFEWVYFGNVASTFDDQSVYVTRKRLGEELGRQETLPIDPSLGDTIVVPVPDTAKAAADSMAYELKIPSQEGLIRNRYVGRTFIEGADRAAKVRAKFTPLPEVLSGKRVFLVEDSIVRSTTMRTLISRIREKGRAREIHVRVACPPIIAPCFYGIDMSTVSELFAPAFMPDGKLTREAEDRMAADLGADSLRFLPVESVSRSLGMSESQLCQACITGNYPTPHGQRLYELALKNDSDASCDGSRTYESREEVEATVAAATQG